MTSFQTTFINITANIAAQTMCVDGGPVFG